MKNSNYTIGNRTRDLLACSTVPQPTVALHAPKAIVDLGIFLGWNRITCISSQSDPEER